VEDNVQPMSVEGNGSISQMPKPLAPDIEQLTRDFRTFIADCETLFHNATTLSGAGASVARAQLSEGMAAAKIKFDAMRMTAADRMQRTRNATEDYVRREPIKAITYAAAAGAVLGLLMSRR
jgi:ElaB/YqjD/DUF883 family membrane-anchored ribosome-binding protein